ncbi:MAG: lysylphosphatidylglycerol synthase domain-containing protein, partial [Solirubrobacteraceae bacterium]
MGSFFDSLSRVGWVPLILGAILFVIYLTLRSRAFYNTLRAAYPTERIPFRKIWGAYIAAYGFNNVIPARGGDVIKLFLVKQSIPNATYPAVGAAICVEAVFDAFMAIFILTFAFSQGVFPKPPDFAKLDAFDLAFLAGHPKFTLFLLTFLAIAALVGFAILSQRVKAFWARVRQGLTILRDRRRYLREVFAWQ